MPSRDAPLSVELPAPGDDRPAWGKVSGIAAAGFALGVLWPRLTNTRVVPNPPADGPQAAATSSAPSGPAALAIPTAPAAPASGGVAATPAPGGSAPGPLGALEPALSVGPGVILKCRDADGEPREDCGTLELDPIAVPRIRALSRCPAAAAANGKLSIGFDVDFRRKTARALLGKSTTLAHEKAEALVRCAESAFDRVSLGDVPHEHQRYTVFYAASFAPRRGAGEPPSEPPVRGPVAGTTVSESPASGTAQVSWEAAILRETPRTGAVVGRVLRGSKVKVIAHQGEWYRVQYGAVEGWVYRGSIGL